MTPRDQQIGKLWRRTIGSIDFCWAVTALCRPARNPAFHLRQVYKSLAILGLNAVPRT